MRSRISFKMVAMVLASAAIGLAGASPGLARGGGGGGHGGSQPGNASVQSVHGPGSSHNPILYRPVHGPGSSHNPIRAKKIVVRDHRPGHYPILGPNRGRDPSPPGGVTVTNGNGQVVPTHLNGGNVYPTPTHGGFNPPIVHDHR